MRTLRFSIVAALTVAVTLSACSSGGSGEGDRSISVGVTDPTTLVPARQSVAFDFSAAVWSPLTFVRADGKDRLHPSGIDRKRRFSYVDGHFEGWVDVPRRDAGERTELYRFVECRGLWTERF